MTESQAAPHRVAYWFTVGIRCGWLLVAGASCGRIDFDSTRPREDGAVPGLSPLAHVASTTLDVRCGTPEFTAGGLAISDAGEVFVGGCFSGDARFGPTTYTAAATESGYILDLDAQLRYRAVVRYGAVGTSDVIGMAIAASSLFVSGTFEGTIGLGGNALTSAGADDLFGARFSIDGSLAHQWSGRFGSTDDEGFSGGLTARADGAMYIGGGCNGTFSFGTQSLPGSSLDPCLGVVRDGVELAAFRWPGANTGGVYAIALGTTGELVLGGDFNTEPPFPGIGVGKNDDGFVARFAPDFSLRWAVGILSDGDDTVRDVELDDAGDVYASGFANASLTIAGAVFPNRGGYDGWVARFGPAGQLVWATTIGGSGDDSIRAALPVGDDVVIAGNFTGTIVVGADTLVSAGDADIFVAALSATDGTVRWARRFGGPLRDYVRRLVRAGSRYFLTGFVTPPIDLGGGSLPGTTDSLFVLELAAP